MTRNLGQIERAIRVALGIVLVSVGYMADLSQGAAIAAYAVGVIALGTAALGFCPAWKLFGINTCQMKASGR
ncbi:MAG: YgaP family membrane protein [Nitrospiraceae bacterium]